MLKFLETRHEHATVGIKIEVGVSNTSFPQAPVRPDPRKFNRHAFCLLWWKNGSSISEKKPL